MSKIALSSNALGTGTLTIASPNTNTDRTLTLPDNTGTLLSTTSTSVLPKGIPAFYAAGAATTLVTNVITKLLGATVVFDTNSCYNSALTRFTPNVAGYYQFDFSAQYTGAAYTSFLSAMMGKNGTFGEVAVNHNLTTYMTITGSRLLYMNGTTDYVEPALNQQSGVNQTANLIYFSGFLVRAD